jgi:hypothetical protein
MDGSKLLLNNLDKSHIYKFKEFLEDVLQKLPNDSFILTPNDITKFLETPINSNPKEEPKVDL